jgi:hypothetical protein
MAHLPDSDGLGPQPRDICATRTVGSGSDGARRRLGTGSVMLASTKGARGRGRRGWVREVGPVKAARTRVGEVGFERFDAAPAL